MFELGPSILTTISRAGLRWARAGSLTYIYHSAYPQLALLSSPASSLVFSTYLTNGVWTFSLP